MLTTPRKITSHVTNPCNDTLEIEVLDSEGAGGAKSHYRISGFNTLTNKSAQMAPDGALCFWVQNILFQNGPIPENGANGITQEVLLAIVADRLECFQAGPFACVENREALRHVKHALLVLKGRTLARLSRGVEGTLTV